LKWDERVVAVEYGSCVASETIRREPPLYRENIAGNCVRHGRVSSRIGSSRFVVSSAHRQHPVRAAVIAVLALIFVSGLHLSSHNGRLQLSIPAACANNIQYAYDALGRIVQAIDTTAGESVAYTYDAAGNITSQTATSLSTLSVGYFPSQGSSGASLTIDGTGFSTNPSANTVTINGVAATVVSATQTQLVITIPAGVTSGPITVQVGAASATTVGSFTATASLLQPTITAFFPSVAAPGTAITIGGTNFATIPSDNSVLFNGSIAQVSASTRTTVSVIVPTSAGSGKVQVITPRGVAVSPTDFIVIPSGYSTSNIGSTGRLPTDGSAATIALPTAGRISVQLFDGTAGQYLTLGVGSTSLASATIKVFSPNGTSLTSGTVTAGGQGVQLPVLPLSGTYTVVVDPGSNTGTLTLSVVQPVQATLTLNGAATPIILSTPGQRALLTFTGTQGTYANVTLSAVTLSAGTVSVLAPNGAVLDSETFGVSGTRVQPQLSMSGTYTVLISPTGSIAGTLSAALTTSSTPALAVNQGINVSLPNTTPVNVPFDAAAGQNLSLGISENSSGVSSATIKVLAPDGSTLTTGTFSPTPCTGTLCTGYSGSSVINFGSVPMGGTYTIVVQQVGSGSGTITLTLSCPVTATLSLGVASSLSAPLPGQALQGTFTAAAGQYVSVGISELPTPSTGSFIVGGLITVLNPDGSVLTNGSFATVACTNSSCGGGSGYQGTAVNNLGPLPMSGNYTVLVQQTTGGTGTLSFAASNPVATTLSIGVASSLSAPLPGQAVQGTFTRTAGQQYVSVGIQEYPPEGSGTYIAGATLTVLNPDGTVVASGTFTPSACVSCGDPLGTGAVGYEGTAVINLGALTESGTYAVLAQQTTGGTGTLTITVSNPLVAALSLGTSSSYAASLAGQAVEGTFTGTAGQYMSISVTESPPDGSGTFVAGATITVLNPDGTLLASGTFTPNVCAACGDPGGTGAVGYDGSAIVNVGPLPATGNYTVLAQQTTGGTGTLALWPESPVAVALPLGATTNVSASQPGQGVQGTFTASAGEYVSLGVSESSGGIAGAKVTVLSPDGTMLTTGSFAPTACSGCTSYSGTEVINFGPLASSGSYSILIQQTSVGSGSLDLTLSNPTNGGTLTAGVPSTIQVPLAGQSIQATFAGTAGTSVDLHVQESYGSSISGATISVTNPDGTPLAKGTFAATTCSGCNGYAGSTDIYPDVLPQTGNYTMLVQQTSAGTGALTLSGNGIQPVTASTTNFSTSTQGQSVSYTFTATAGQSVGIGISNLVFTPSSNGAPGRLYVYTPSGTQLGNFTYCYATTPGCQVSLTNLPQSGTYTVQVIPPGQMQMSFTLGFSQDTGGVLPPSTTPTSLTFGVPGEDGQYTFTATAGQSFALYVGSISTTPANESVTATVYNSAGTAVASASGTTNLTVNLLGLAADTYTAVIVPAYGATGTAQVTLAPALGGALSSGTSTSEAASVPGQEGYFTFTGTAGQSVGIGISNLVFTPSSNGAPGRLYVYTPSGTQLGNFTYCYATTPGCQVSLTNLPQSGTYTVQVIPPGQMQMSFTLGFSQDTGGVLPPSTTPTSLTFGVPGEDGQYTFTATAGQSFALYVGSISTTPANESVTATVYNSAGTAVASASGTTNLTVNLLGLAADTYTAVIVPAYGATGTAQVTLAPALGGALSSGTSTSEAASVPGQEGYFTFTGTAGQSVGIGISNLVFTPSSNGAPGRLYVYTPSGTQLGNFTYCYVTNPGAGCQVSLTNLPQSGTYTVQLIPPGQQQMSFTVGFSQDAGGALPPSTTPTSLSFGVPGEDGQYTFTATAGQSFALNVGSISTTPANESVTATVYNSAGAVVGSASGTTSLTVNLLNLAAGTYTAVIVPQYGATGTAQVTLAPQLGGALSSGTSASESASVPGQEGYFTFTGTAGQSVGVGISNLVFTPSSNGAPAYLYVYTPSGTQLGNVTYCYVTNPGSGCQVSLTNLPQSGTYTVQLIPPGQQQMSFTITQSLDPTATLSSGTPTSVNLGTVGEGEILSFTTTASETVTLTVSDVTTTPANTSMFIYVYNSAWSEVTGASTSTGTTLTMTNLAAGTYEVVIYPQYPATSSMQVVYN
jgi:YD repeat-containing protein